MEVPFQERLKQLFESSEYGKKVLEYATMISESNYKQGLDYYLLNAVNDLLDRMEEIGDMTKFEVQQKIKKIFYFFTFGLTLLC